LPDVPQSIAAKGYSVSVLNLAGTLLRTTELQGPSYLYPVVAEVPDFGALQT
jgi:hypothetical protein